VHDNEITYDLSYSGDPLIRMCDGKNLSENAQYVQGGPKK